MYNLFLKMNTKTTLKGLIESQVQYREKRQWKAKEQRKDKKNVILTIRREDANPEYDGDKPQEQEYGELLKTLYIINNDLNSTHNQRIDICIKLFRALNFDWSGYCMPDIMKLLLEWFSKGDYRLQFSIVNVIMNATYTNQCIPIFRILYEPLLIYAQESNFYDIVEHILWIFSNFAAEHDIVLKMLERNDLFSILEKIAGKWGNHPRICKKLVLLFHHISITKPSHIGLTRVCIWMKSRLELISDDEEFVDSLMTLHRVIHSLDECTLTRIFDSAMLDYLMSCMVLRPTVVQSVIQIFDSLICLPNPIIAESYGTILTELNVFLHVNSIMGSSLLYSERIDLCIWFIMNLCEDPKKFINVFDSGIIGRIYELLKSPRTLYSVRGNCIMILCRMIELYPTYISALVDEGCIELLAEYMNRYSKNSNPGITRSILLAAKLILDRGIVERQEYYEVMESHGLKAAIEDHLNHKNDVISTLCETILKTYFHDNDGADISFSNDNVQANFFPFGDMF
jgi:hypothetical protein